jgi:hypothetical protein
MQELITLLVFTAFAVAVLNEKLEWRYLASFAWVLGAVYSLVRSRLKAGEISCGVMHLPKIKKRGRLHPANDPRFPCCFTSS